MKAMSMIIITACGLALSACGSDTVVHETPVVVAPAAGLSPSSVEATCPHGYDNRTHSCY